MIKTTSGSSARGACPFGREGHHRYSIPRRPSTSSGCSTSAPTRSKSRGSWGRATPSTASLLRGRRFRSRTAAAPGDSRSAEEVLLCDAVRAAGWSSSLRAEGDRPSPPASRTSELALDAPTGTCRRTGGAARGRSAGGSPQTSGRRRRRLSRCNHARVLHRPPSRLTPHRASTPPSRCRWFSPDIDFIRLIMCARPAMYVSSPRSRPVARRLFRARSRGRVRGRS